MGAGLETRRYDPHNKRMFESFLAWRKVRPTIEDQVLERVDGAVEIRFSLDNRAGTPVSFVKYEGDFVAGDYESHPSGDKYTIEGDDREIAVWFYPAEYYRDPPTVHTIAAGEQRALTASVSVPDDMPNPVQVSICVLGPFVEANSRLGEPKKLRWVDQAATASDDATGTPAQSDPAATPAGAGAPSP